MSRPVPAPVVAAAPASPGPAFRTSPAVVSPNMPSWHSSSAPGGAKKNAALQAERKAPVEMLTLTLGDFLPRIPERFLDAGEHDPSTPLPFDLAALSERIGRGDSEIFLSEIYRRIPDVFRSDVVIAPHQTIRFPWSRVLALVTHASGSLASSPGLSAAGVETLSLKVKARKFRQAVTKKAPSLRPPAQPAPEMEAVAATLPAEPEAEPPSLMLVPANAAVATPTAPPEIPVAPVAAPAGENDSGSGVELQQLRAEQAQRLIAMRNERDQLQAAIAPLRAELAGLVKQTELERQVAAEVSAKLARLEKAHAEIVETVEALQSERDAARARSAEFGAEHDAAIARTGALTAERDATLARATALSAEQEAAHACAAELTVARDAADARAMVLICERDTALAHAAELARDRDSAQAGSAELAAERTAALACVAGVTAERDTALTRTGELTAELAAAQARAGELIAERDAALATAARQTADSEAAVALATELTAERDAARARLTDFQTATETAEQAVWGSRAAAQFEADIEGYRNRIQALLRERDGLRKELAAAAAAPAPSPPLPDAYSDVFPRPRRISQTAAALALVIVGFLFAEKIHRPAEPAAQPEAVVQPAPL